MELTISFSGGNGDAGGLAVRWLNLALIEGQLMEERCPGVIRVPIARVL
jgi:hypothetical protein